MMNTTKYALLSVYNKKDIEKLASFLLKQNFKLITSDGTYRYLTNHLDNTTNIQTVSSITGYPEMLGGRVKTLHPKIHAGLLSTTEECINDGTYPNITVLVANLYPFHEIYNEHKNINDPMSLMDIGGHAMIRAAIKNYKKVLTIVNPNDYTTIMKCQDIELSDKFKQMYAKMASEYITKYDGLITYYLSNQHTQCRLYNMHYELKYGVNPHQKPAKICSINNNTFPFKQINPIDTGVGYINYLDAIYGWQLVKDLKKIFNLPAAASFKHNSPAGMYTCIYL